MKTYDQLAKKFNKSHGTISQAVRDLNKPRHKRGRFYLVDQKGERMLEQRFKPKKNRFTEGAKWELLPYGEV